VPRIALVVYLAFLAVAFGWRSWRHYRRTGDVGFRGLKPGAGVLERLAGALFVLALVATLLTPIGALHGWAPAIAAVDRLPTHLVGLLLSAAGIGIALVAQLHMGDSWRIGVDPGERTALVRDGLFGRVRNPIFSGMLAATLGLLCLVPGPLGLSAWLLLLVAIELQVRSVEEPHLVSTHGADYADYARRVGRFFPGLGRLR
jgi:protein-S-isoprenylcysteine O-methyltransferase Ste14